METVFQLLHELDQALRHGDAKRIENVYLRSEVATLKKIDGLFNPFEEFVGYGITEIDVTNLDRIDYSSEFDDVEKYTVNIKNRDNLFDSFIIANTQEGFKFVFDTISDGSIDDSNESGNSSLSDQSFYKLIHFCESVGTTFEVVATYSPHVNNSQYSSFFEKLGNPKNIKNDFDECVRVFVPAAPVDLHIDSRDGLDFGEYPTFASSGLYFEWRIADDSICLFVSSDNPENPSYLVIARCHTSEIDYTPGASSPWGEDWTKSLDEY